MKQDSTESEVKHIEDETLRIKSEQPFFDGQLDMKIVQSSNSYDYYFTGDYTPGRSQNFRCIFTADTQELPFCQFYPVIKDGSGNVYSAYVISCLEATDGSINYSNGKTVTCNFNTGIDYNATNNTFYVKLYCISSDTGTITVESR